jgi:hypothetical protein
MNTGVVHGHRLQPLDDAAWQRADVGAAVAADLRLVAQAAERHAIELARQRVGDRAPERGLAHARRAREAEDRTLVPRLQLAHGKEVEDALLHFLEAEVIAVQDARRVIDVGGVVGSRATTGR